MARWTIVAAAVLLGWAETALAAGGAHVVDDSEVETPGQCHVENWAAFESGHARFFNIGPGCTGLAHPNLELGGYASYQHQRGPDEATIGLAPKLQLRPVSSGFGIAVDTALGFGLRRGRVETASIVVPMSLPISPAIQLNVDIGGKWVRTDHRVRAFAGTQIVAQVAPKLALMAEGFGWSGRPAGAQTGLRRTFDKGRCDIDLLAAHYVDGIARDAVTIGLIIRR